LFLPPLSFSPFLEELEELELLPKPLPSFSEGRVDESSLLDAAGAEETAAEVPKERASERVSSCRQVGHFLVVFIASVKQTVQNTFLKNVFKKDYY
jgi:hypothetical protein